MKADRALVDSIRDVALFHGLSDKCLAGIASEMKPHAFHAGDVVIEQDEAGRFGRLFVILDGAAVASIGDNELAQYGPGDYFGEMSLLDGKPRSATVTATSELSTVGLTSWSMRSLINENPEIAQHVIEVLVSRLRALDARFND